MDRHGKANWHTLSPILRKHANKLSRLWEGNVYSLTCWNC